VEPGAEQPQPIPAAERLGRWNEQLLRQLLPRQDAAHTPVLLACDDEAIRVAGQTLGSPPEAALDDLVRAVVLVFDVGRSAGFKRALTLGSKFASEPRPRRTPPFLALLALLVLAATRMAPDERNATQAYYVRLFELFPNLGSEPRSPDGFYYVPQLFAALAEWLEADEEGARGALLLPESPSPKFVGTCVSQTVFRARDRQVLSRFFSERLSGLSGFDPLLLLRRWGGRSMSRSP
jgi:hypothetical protein